MDFNQNISLGLAAASGDLNYVKECIQKCGLKDINKPYNGMTPLCLAAFWGNSDIVDFLLQQGADVNIQSPQTLWTPCHCAAFQGHGKVLMSLLEYSPNLTLKDKEQRTAIDFASGVDAVWPIFAAVGCKRTSKTELLAKKIIFKLAENQTSNTSYESRPGSAYGIRDIDFTSNDNSEHKKRNYYNNGDVLNEVDEDLESNQLGMQNLALNSSNNNNNNNNNNTFTPNFNKWC